MRQFKSCGFIVMRTVPQLSFLLMQHSHRYDLPKGHMEMGEDEWACALRELHEETGIPASALKLDRTFRFTNTYKTRYKRYGKEKIEKTVVIFLGWLQQNVTVQLSEHSSYKWVEWNPPHLIQKKTIDPLLGKLEQYFLENTAKRLN